MFPSQIGKMSHGKSIHYSQELFEFMVYGAQGWGTQDQLESKVWCITKFPTLLIFDFLQKLAVAWCGCFTWKLHSNYDDLTFCQSGRCLYFLLGLSTGMFCFSVWALFCFAGDTVCWHVVSATPRQLESLIRLSDSNLAHPIRLPPPYVLDSLT